MTRQAGHKHDFRIVAHTTEAQGKAVRVLLGCACATTEVIRPHGGKKRDPEFFAGLRNYQHLCCDALPSLQEEETAA